MECEPAELPIRFEMPGGRTLWVVAIDLGRSSTSSELAAPIISLIRSLRADGAEQAA